jgi:hypothetical protein
VTTLVNGPGHPGVLFSTVIKFDFSINWLTAPSNQVLTVKFRQPSHEFTFGVGMSFISYPLVLTPLI